MTGRNTVGWPYTVSMLAAFGLVCLARHLHLSWPWSLLLLVAGGTVTAFVVVFAETWMTGRRSQS